VIRWWKRASSRLVIGFVNASFRRLLRRYFWGMDIHPSVRIANTAYIDRTWPRGIHIAAGCIVGEEAVILTHDMTRGLYLDTRIGAGCRLGPRSIILPGLALGDGCVVAPGAVVTKDMPPRSYAIGNPAQIAPLSE
jgi:acetyltransferase-like isoleucine patch superfamily enzyme